MSAKTTGRTHAHRRQRPDKKGQEGVLFYLVVALVRARVVPVVGQLHQRQRRLPLPGHGAILGTPETADV